MKRTIGLDLDGVLYNWHGVIHDYLVKFKGEELKYKEFWKRAKEEGYKKDLLCALVEIPMFYTQRNISNHVLEVVKQLAENNIIYYITTRPENAEFATKSWIKRSGLPYPDNLIVTQNKRPHISMLECDYFVDDKQKTIDEIKDITNAILFKSDYMQDEDTKGYNYIESLDELLEVNL
jgi:5'(3')-deoxyribonucleotidase